MGVVFISIDKTGGPGLEAGRMVAQRNPIAGHRGGGQGHRCWTGIGSVAIGSRWQPYPRPRSSGHRGIITDPSQVQGRTSKMIIDATRWLPEEGGRENSETNRAPRKGAPEALAEADKLFGAVSRLAPV